MTQIIKKKSKWNENGVKMEATSMKKRSDGGLGGDFERGRLRRRKKGVRIAAYPTILAPFWSYMGS